MVGDYRVDGGDTVMSAVARMPGKTVGAAGRSKCAHKPRIATPPVLAMAGAKPVTRVSIGGIAGS